MNTPRFKVGDSVRVPQDNLKTTPVCKEFVGMVGTIGRVGEYSNHNSCFTYIVLYWMDEDGEDPYEQSQSTYEHDLEFSEPPEPLTVYDLLELHNLYLDILQL